MNTPFENETNQTETNQTESHTQDSQTTETKFSPYDSPTKPKSGSSTPTWGKIVAVGVGCSILGGIVGAGAASFFGNGSSGQSQIYQGDRPTSNLQVNAVDTSKVLTPAELYAQNVNSTVGITTSITTTNIFGLKTQGAAAGSGFILSDDGYILTNHHVIDKATKVTVTMYDGTAYDAQIMGYDQANDIAVLKIDAEGLTPVVLGDSDLVNVGDSVIAIGNPLGELTFSLTSGVVSALDRQVTFSGGISMDLIQTDAAINSGNSGGALFNQYGEVVGITNAKFSSSSSSGAASIDNIGFAIPMNTVMPLVKSIIETGAVTKPYIGVTVAGVSEEAQIYGLPAGASVQMIEEGSPAEKSGLQINDIIIKADDEEITNSAELVKYISGVEPGTEVALTVYRNGKELNITLTVGEKTKPAINEEPEATQQSYEQRVFPFFG